MKTILQLSCGVLFAFVIVSCKATWGEYTTANGARVKFRDVRCGLNTGAAVSVQTISNGVSVSAEAQSAPNVQMIEGIARGVAAGLSPAK